MPGVGSIADCHCGYHAFGLRHGISEVLNMERIVIAYAQDRPELISIRMTDAKKQGLDFIEEYPEGGGYFCPACKRNTLTFSFSGLHWD